MEILRKVKWNRFPGGAAEKCAYKLLYIIFTDRPTVFRVEE
jgi:hypothetical protein